MRSTIRSGAGLVALSVLLALAVVELVLRIWFPLHMVGSVDLVEYDPELGVRARPGYAGIQLSDHRQEYLVNTFGTSNHEADFEQYDRLIFALGDSYTQGIGAPPDASWPFQLGLSLNLDHDGGFTPRYGVVNLGLGGYSFKQSLIQLDRFSERLGKPDLVLFLGAENDVHDDRLFDAGHRHRHLIDGTPGYLGLAGTLGRVAESVEILKRLKVVLGGIGKPRPGSPTRKQSDTPRPSKAERLQPRFMELKSRAEALNARLVVGWSACTRSQEWLRAWARDNDVGFADWCPGATAIRAHMPGLEIRNAHSAGHNRVWINRLIARAYRTRIEAPAGD